MPDLVLLSERLGRGFSVLIIQRRADAAAALAALTEVDVVA
jgi:hypothetical protein